MEPNPVFSQGTKRLLKNFIRHTGTHNRIQEENEMWKQYEKSRQEDTRKYTPRQQKSYLEDKRDDMNDDRYKMKSRSAHMDDNRDDSSTYWMRQLEKTEAADPERWGHSGFKEMYPADFHSDRSDQDSSSSSSSTTSSSEEERRKRKKRKKKKRRKKKAELEWVESESVTSDRKNTDLNNRKTKKRKSEQFDNKSNSVSPPKRLKKHKNKDRHKKKKHKKHKD